MKGKKLLTLVVAGVVVSTTLLFSGCSSTKSSTNSNTSTATESSKPDADQTINLIATDPSSFDPSAIDDTASATVIDNVFEGLMVEGTKDGKVVNLPAGAESFTTNSDKTVYTFKLRKDAKWSDGQPVTAKDYVYSWQRLTDPVNGPAGDYMGFLADLSVKNAEEVANKQKPVSELGVKAVDDYTFEVTLVSPNPSFEKALAFQQLCPQREDVAKKLGDKYGSDFKNMVFNGPFVLDDYQKASKIIYKKNDNYWDAKNVKLTKAVANVIDEPTTMVKMFETGEIDQTGASGDNIKKLQQEATQKGSFKEYTGSNPSTFYYLFNNKNKFLANANVRKALSTAFDRQTLLNAVYKRYIPAMGLIPPKMTVGSTDYRQTVAEPLKGKTVADAKKYIADGVKELGLSSAADIHLTVFMSQSTSTTQANAQFIQNQWQNNLGIKVDIKYAPDTKTYFKQRSAGDFDICTGGWSSDFNEPYSFFGTLVSDNGNNNGKYSNPKYDDLIKQASSEMDDSKRLNLYKQAEQLAIADDAALAPMYYQDVHNFRYNYVKGMYLPQYGADYYLKNVYISGKTK